LNYPHRLKSGRIVDLEEIKNYFLLGATLQRVASLLRMSEAELESAISEDAELRAAVARGQDFADAEVAQALHRRATGYKGRETKVVTVAEQIKVVEFEQYYAPDVGAAKFWLSQRRPERWGPRDGMSGVKGDEAAKVDAVRKELDSRLARLAAAAEKGGLDQRAVAGRA